MNLLIYCSWYTELPGSQQQQYNIPEDNFTCKWRCFDGNPVVRILHIWDYTFLQTRYYVKPLLFFLHFNFMLWRRCDCVLVPFRHKKGLGQGKKNLYFSTWCCRHEHGWNLSPRLLENIRFSRHEHGYKISQRSPKPSVPTVYSSDSAVLWTWCHSWNHKIHLLKYCTYNFAVHVG